ncbi:MAG: aldehyde ferredoxin oxidoreductase family protein, partial [Candidatus Helarchaeota archaeon]
MPFGYMGKILRVDLSTETVEPQEIPEEYYRKYIGGRGLSTRILYDDLPKGLDPLDPDNEVIFMTGPYTGLAAPGAARFDITTLSPLTNQLGAANSGGFFGPALKRAGCDGVIIRGKAKSPVYLWVSEGEGELKSADHLWGKDTYKTEDLIKKELDKPHARVACIGPAGENLILYSSVICDKGRAAARSGAGAVLGSKRFKAIACFGKCQPELAYKDKFKEVSAYYNKKVLNDPAFKVIKLYGSNGFLLFQLITGDVPVKNWTKSNFNGAEKISGHAMYKTVLVKDKACQGCVISCKRSVKIDKGKYKLPENPASGPEYETVAALGSMCMIDNIYAITKANDMCNRYGLDTISTGSVIAFAMECLEKGLITKEDLHGIDLRWGNPDSMIACIDLITKKRGLGALLAQGTKRASQEIEGSQNFSVNVKGLEVAMHDPRAMQMFGLHYVTTPYGGHHSSAGEAFV